jgi:hypothetical protein
MKDFEFAGSKRPDVILGGHSHVISMLPAVDRPPSLGLGAAVLVPRGGSKDFLSDPGYLESFALSTKGKVAVLVWNGNQHNGSFLFDSTPPFQVFQQGVVDASHDLGRVWVSQETLRSFWRSHVFGTTEELEKLLHRLGESSNRVVLLGTPPPKSERFIREALHHDGFFKTLLAKESLQPEDVPLTPGPVRIAMWRIIQSIYEDAAHDAGALFVPVPGSVMDHDGYLLEELSPPGDASHGNGDYGAAMWEQLANALGRSDG